MKIICGTDFSDNAARGTTVAAVLAGKLQDRFARRRPWRVLPRGHERTLRQRPRDAR